MTSLNSLLNPESGHDRDTHHRHVPDGGPSTTSSHHPSPVIDQPHPTSASQLQAGSSSPPLQSTYDRLAIGASYYAQTDIIIRPHEPHPDCPDTLACLPDTNGRPQHTLPVILRCAILGSPKKRLTIREIYAAMERKYPYYKTAGPAWKQSVRHHLSLNRLFERQQRPATDPGFGSYWTVNLNAPPGTKRPRKRGRSSREAGPPTPLLPPEAPYRMPREYDEPHHTDLPQIATLRPVDAHSFATSAVRSRSYDEEDEDELAWEGGPEVHSDEYYSDEEHNYQYKPRPLTSGSSSAGYSHNNHGHHPLGVFSHPPSGHASAPIPVNVPPPPPLNHFSHPSSPSHGHMHGHHGPPPPQMVRQSSRAGLHGVFSNFNGLPGSAQEPLIDRLRSEMDALKRQSNDAEALSRRLTSDLARAEADASRAKAALRMSESRLEDETRRRIEAERAVDEEARGRRAAEDALRQLQMQTRVPLGQPCSR